SGSIGGLDTSATYFVRVIDAYTIKLYTTWAEAMGQGDAAVKDFAAPAPVTFKTSAVEGGPANSGLLGAGYPNTIYLPGNTYQKGDAVVYQPGTGSTPLIDGSTGKFLVAGRTYYVTFPSPDV